MRVSGSQRKETTCTLLRPVHGRIMGPTHRKVRVITYTEVSTIAHTTFGTINWPQQRPHLLQHFPRRRHPRRRQALLS